MSQSKQSAASSPADRFQARAGTSPISRGGAGTEFENPVAAYYLALALLQAAPRGQWTGITETVRFQQFFAGEPLDDLVVVSQVTTEDRQIVLPRLSLQMKRKIAVTEDNDTFDEVLKACWNTFRLQNQDGTPRFRFRFDRFGIVFNIYNATIDTHYRPLLEWARDSASPADFIARVAPDKAANAEQQKFVTWIRRKLDGYNGSAVDDETVWQFFASLVFLDFDFGNEGSKDYAYIIEMLRRLLPSGEHGRAPELWLKLNYYATTAKSGSGSFEGAELCERLRADGFPLLQAGKDCRADTQRLESEAQSVLAEIGTTIDGLSLTRLEVLHDARSNLEESSFLLLTGAYGVGKSALLKRLVSLWREQSPTLVLSGDDINRLPATSWNTYAIGLGIKSELGDLLTALGSGPQPAIFIDGIDKVVSAGARRVIRDLLHVARALSVGSDDTGAPVRRWKVVATARQENIQDVQAWLGEQMDEWQPLSSYVVPPLSASEAKEVFDRVPRLRPLLNVVPLQELLLRPFLLNLLCDPRLAGAPEIKQAQINTEVDVCHLWWERVVGLRGVDENAGEERKTLLLAMGVLAAKQPGRWIPRGAIGATSTAAALTSLQKDGILSKDADTDRLRLRRDPIEEWVIYRMLIDAHQFDLPQYLREIEQPLGLYRAVQLLGMHLIERNPDASNWGKLLLSVEADSQLESRWREALLCSPLLSTRVAHILKEAQPLLLESDAHRLCDLLRAVRTIEVNPDFAFARVLTKHGMASQDAQSLAMAQSQPRFPIWRRLLEWMIPQVADWPTSVRLEAAYVMQRWQQATLNIPNCPFRREIAEISLCWLQEVELILDDDYEPTDW